MTFNTNTPANATANVILSTAIATAAQQQQSGTTNVPQYALGQSHFPLWRLESSESPFLAPKVRQPTPQCSLRFDLAMECSTPVRNGTPIATKQHKCAHTNNNTWNSKRQKRQVTDNSTRVAGQWTHHAVGRNVQGNSQSIRCLAEPWSLRLHTHAGTHQQNTYIKARSATKRTAQRYTLRVCAEHTNN